MGTHPIFESDFDFLTEIGLKISMVNTEQEIQLKALYAQIRQKRKELKRIKLAILNEKKNAIPLVQKQIIDKKLTEEELAKTVKNASSNTELAKKLVAQGKITIDAKKS